MSAALGAAGAEVGGMAGRIREAGETELADWDRRTVDVAGGNVLQSLAWARHRARTGWLPDHLVLADGRAVLVLRRPWPVVGGFRAYVPRGPVTAGDPPAEVAARLATVTAWLAARGADVVTTDAELPVHSGYGELIRGLGFVPCEEVEPARHRMSLPLAGRAEDEILAAIVKATRQRIRQAEGEGIQVRRFDTRAANGPGDGFVAGSSGELPAALARFHTLVQATGERRGFELGPPGPFIDWLVAAHAAGHAIYLEALPGGAGAGPIAGLIIYRHGDRLSTAISGDDAAARERHPGVLHLLRWRAIQLAIREGRAEMDLGGVDVAGARGEPRPGGPMYGLYQHKRSFGATFVAQVGAHERRLRPVHLAVARTAARLGRLVAR